MSFGSKSTKTTQQTSSTGQVDPWDETIPYLKSFLDKLGATGNGATPGATAEQLAAYDTLKANAKAGNPNAGEIDALAKDQFNAPDRSGVATEGYADFVRRLTPTADGTNTDPSKDPVLQRMLTQVADEAQNRTNAQFAAAGRDFSGANQGAVAKGVTEAQTPLLLDFLSRERGRTDQAARDLYSGSGQQAGLLSGLDAARSALRSAGIETTKEGMAARDAGPNTVLNLEQQLKALPYEDLSKIAALLFPAAGLGQQTQSTGTATGTAKQSGFSIGLTDIGKMIGALGAI